MDIEVKRYIRFGAIVCLLLLTIWGAGQGGTKAVMTVSEQTGVRVEETMESDMTDTTLTAGVANLFGEDFFEQIYVDSEETENGAEYVEAPAGAEIESRTVEEGETEAFEDEYGNLAIANVDKYVNVRTAPNTDSEIVGKMYDDSVAQILETVGEGDDQWFQVVSGNVEGYIKAEYFIYGDAAAEAIDDYVIRYAVVKADRLNVRQEPNTESKRIGYIDFGEKVKILELGEEWHKVQYTNDKEGFVCAEYVTVEEQFIYAKSIEEERKEKEAQALLAARNAESDTSKPENVTIREVVPPTDYSNVSELRNAIVNYAMQFLGNRYVHGGQSLVTGTDCSGFTSYTYAAFGYSLSRTPQGQWGSNGRQITMAEIQPGDIVCYSSSGGKCTHVALYIGNGQVIHAANPRSGVIISNVYYDNTFIGIKNVLD